MRLGRTARLAAAVLTGGVLAAAAGCSARRAARAGGTSSGSAPPARTLTPAPRAQRRRIPPRPGPPTGATSPAAAWPPAWPAPGPLTVSWRAHLDGAVYGQPLLVGDLVIAATENDSLYGLDQATGQVIWRTHVGTPVPLSDLPCGNIDPLGITGTPVYDPASGLVYAVAETTGYHHVLVGVSVARRRRAGGARHPDPGRAAAVRPAAARARRIAGRAGVRGVRRAVRRLRSVPRLGGGHPAQRQRAADLLRGADPARGGRLGHRGPGHRPGRHHVRQRGQRRGDRQPLRRQRLGDRAVPRPAPDRRLRAVHLGR